MLTVVAYFGFLVIALVAMIGIYLALLKIRLI
jgi:hypothetical protein